MRRSGYELRQLRYGLRIHVMAHEESGFNIINMSLGLLVLSMVR